MFTTTHFWSGLAWGRWSTLSSAPLPLLQGGTSHGVATVGFTDQTNQWISQAICSIDQQLHGCCLLLFVNPYYQPLWSMITMVPMLDGTCFWYFYSYSSRHRYNIPWLLRISRISQLPAGYILLQQVVPKPVDSPSESSWPPWWILPSAPGCSQARRNSSVTSPPSACQWWLLRGQWWWLVVWWLVSG